MKRFLALILALCMVFALCACGGDKEPAGDTDTDTEGASFKVAMITDYGDITDQSFNQTTYEACKEYCDANNVDFNYFKPASDSDADRVAMIDKAVADGYNVIVMPGFAFANAVKETVGNYPDVKFVALDVGAGDLNTYNDDGSIKEEFQVPDNLYCAVYQEELCGYMAGYAAVKLGYKQLGFLGGMAVPAVVRYGYGFLQGVDAAAAELNIADQVSVKYVYGNTFGPDPAVKAVMDTWFNGGTEVVFACGGGIYISAAEAAQAAGAKLIGVDVDQSGIIDSNYGEGMTVTSAMKGLAPTVKTVLTAIAEDKWADFGGKIDTLGLVSENPEENYVQIPMTTQFGDGFSADDYKALVADMFNGVIKVDNSADTENLPEVAVKVETFDNIL
ncbi:MAG: BMP family ABC transporter substrate-binding protein [Oscillospiraceae bacterium]